MFAPKLYTVRKYPLKYIIDNNMDIQSDVKEDMKYDIKQQDNMLFRQIRNITNSNRNFNKWIVFVDCSSGKSDTEALSKIVTEGFKVNNQHFVIGERSASMTRTGILSFIDSNIANELEESIRMGIKPQKMVLSKWYAYRGLMLSACHCIEDWIPRIIIIPDFITTIKNQNIKYVYDKEVNFVDKDGNERVWVQKDIDTTIKDVDINAFDGCGIHHPKITEFIQNKIRSKTLPTSILWRMPFIKGVTHQIDYVDFFESIGVNRIKDIWGVYHDVTRDSEPALIITESMYKGKKYFQTYNDERDWENYIYNFKKYNHCVGIAKWNFSKEEEPVYTRSNYQILQDLNLKYNDFASLAKYSIDWTTKIINGDMLYTYCFLGLTDQDKAVNNYTKAICKNPEMLKEYSVRNYFISLINKYIDEMKCGKLWIKSCFKFLVPDLIMLMEHAAEIEPNGCLKENEFYTSNINGPYHGNYLIERNPHICKSEHVILNAVNNSFTDKYFSDLSNVCIVNCKSITPQRLNGADYDGDLVLVIDNKTMMSGVDPKSPIVIDIDDKITVSPEYDTTDNKLKIILRTMNSLIGETSNCATSYHNKQPKSKEQKQKYEGYIDLLSVINGKAVDFAKTGVIFNIPRHIAKYSKPLPYFMKYASEYYGKFKKFNKSQSNMNRLCMEIEKWEKSFRWKRSYDDFNYKIMMDETIEFNQERFSKIENIFLEFCKEMRQLSVDQILIRNEIGGFSINWQYYYDIYKKKCMDVTSNIKELANYSVILCYEKYKNKNKKFIWRVAGDGVVENIKQVDFTPPKRDPNGSMKYLGKTYSFKRG